jgi:hypothetical protein
MYRPVRGRSIRAGSRQGATGRRQAPASRRRGLTPRGVLVLVVALVCVAAAGGALALLLSGRDKPASTDTQQTFQNVPMNDETIYEGVYVDELSLGGLTCEQAKEQIEAHQAEYAKVTGVTITKGTMKVQYTI